jgi:membrane protease YdiL (CAAX protease family)
MENRPPTTTSFRNSWLGSESNQSLEKGKLTRPTCHAAQPKTIEAVLQSKIESVQDRRSAAARVEKSRYQIETRRPIVCLAFVMPLILAYEIGVILLGHGAARSGIDQWLDQVLHSLGFGQFVLLPLVTAGIMITWHHRLDDHWRIRWPVLSGMSLEAIGLGLLLFWAANAFHLVYASEFVAAIPSVRQIQSMEQSWATTMAFVGSGIYEELFFRLMLLLPAIYGATQFAGKRFGTAAGILAVSLLFAVLHYNVINPAGADFELSSFVFRIVASIVFCVLFLFRGFGIAVGTHVAFDLLTQI